VATDLESVPGKSFHQKFSHLVDAAISEVIEKSMKKLSIKHKVTTIYKPNTNGLVEHRDKVLCNILSKEVEVRKNLHNWHKQVHCALWAYNSTFKLSIGFTFFHLAYGVESTLPIEYEVMTFDTTKQHQLGIESKNCWNWWNWWNWKKANCEHNKLSN
jgi:hypothetical protein